MTDYTDVTGAPTEFPITDKLTLKFAPLDFSDLFELDDWVVRRLCEKLGKPESMADQLAQIHDVQMELASHPEWHLRELNGTPAGWLHQTWLSVSKNQPEYTEEALKTLIPPEKLYDCFRAANGLSSVPEETSEGQDPNVPEPGENQGSTRSES